MNKFIYSLFSALLIMGTISAQTLPQDISKARTELNSARVQFRSQLVSHGQTLDKLLSKVGGSMATF